MKRNIILSLLLLVTLFGCSTNITNIDSTSEAPFSNEKKETSSSSSQLDIGTDETICDIGELLTLFENPGKVLKGSEFKFNVHCGHLWNGTEDFSKISEDYLTWSYKLIFSYTIGSSYYSGGAISNWPQKIVKDLPNFNTSEYDVDIKDNNSDTLINGQSFEITIENSIFQLSDDEIGKICFYIEIYDKEDNIITNHDLNWYIMVLSFLNDGEHIKFTSDVREIFHYN